ncbi:MAG: aminotransferase class V-fold PLP-dependent enzyme, partial [Planctomycetes bacterium]|nr:aminotransferase class V-fold PLP-dependent enzyme [Planctomycetota bacterium]
MRAFLDANAGAPPSEAVKEAVAKLLKDNLLNPSGHGELSKALRDRIEDCRAQVANFFGADPIEIVFTSGGSESINTAIASAAAQHQGNVLFSGAEHPATISAVQIHAQGRGLALPVDGNALLKPFDAKGAALVSALWANNEVGSINDVNALDQACSAAGVTLHLDAVCAA